MTIHQPASTRYKIAMVAASPFPYPQGSQVLISQLATALQQRGHQVRLWTYAFGSGQPPEGIELNRIPDLPGLSQTSARPSWKKPFLDVQLTREFSKGTRQWRPDLIHTHNFEGLLVALTMRRLRGIPVVYHIHNAMGLELHTYFDSAVGRWAGGIVGRWVDAHLVHRADHCIVLTEEAATYFRRQGVERLHVVPPGIDYRPGQAGRARAKLGDGPLVLYSGNLDRYQDLDLLLQAFELVARDRPEAKLVLSTHSASASWQTRVPGTGSGSRVVVAEAETFGEVSDLMAASDVAVCPRTNCLGFPIKLLNYMAAGRAIVASEGSAMGVRHMENGLVVEDGNVPDLATAIVRLLDDPALARRLGAEARRMVQVDYSWDRACGAIEEVYARAVR